MLSILRFELVFFALLPSVFAAPLFGINLGSSNNAATSAVSQNTVTSQLFRPALFSRAAYCSPDSVTNFTCGAACDAVKGIQILHADGDQGAVPRCESSYSHDQITRHPSIKAWILIWWFCFVFWCSFHCYGPYYEFCGCGSWGYRSGKHSLHRQWRRILTRRTGLDAVPQCSWCVKFEVQRNLPNTRMNANCIVLLKLVWRYTMGSSKPKIGLPMLFSRLSSLRYHPPGLLASWLPVRGNSLYHHGLR